MECKYYYMSDWLIVAQPVSFGLISDRNWPRTKEKLKMGHNYKILFTYANKASKLPYVTPI